MAPNQIFIDSLGNESHDLLGMQNEDQLEEALRPLMKEKDFDSTLFNQTLIV